MSSNFSISHFHNIFIDVASIPVDHVILSYYMYMYSLVEEWLSFQ